MAKLINASAVKKYTKDLLTKERPKYTRVSQEFVDNLDAQLKAWIVSYVGMYTGPGKTLMPPGGTVIPPRQQNRFVREHVWNSITSTCKFCGQLRGHETKPCEKRRV